MKLVDAIDNIFSHNEIVAIWKKIDEYDGALVWEGMAWNLPGQYKGAEKWRVFGLIPESILKADVINIEILDGE